MLTGSSRKLWLVIGAAGSLVIVVLGYLLLVSGKKTERADLQESITSSQDQASANRAKIAALKLDNEKLPLHRQRLAALQAALPKTSSSAEFVREMQSLGNASGVTITNLAITAPVAAVPTAAPASPASGESSAASTPAPAAPGAPAAAAVAEMPITLSASGSTVNLERFVKLLQSGSVRAVVLEKVAENAPTETSGGGDKAASKPTITLNLKAFVASA